MKHRTMYMKDYIQHLDAILSSTGEQLLNGCGTVSHGQAMEKAEKEYRKFDVRTLSPVEQAYLDNIKILNKKLKERNSLVCITYKCPKLYAKRQYAILHQRKCF